MTMGYHGTAELEQDAKAEIETLRPSGEEPTAEDFDREEEAQHGQQKRGDDPQWTYHATLRRSRKSENEILTFSIRLWFFEVAFIVNLPDDEAQVGDKFPVYARHKVHRVFAKHG